MGNAHQDEAGMGGSLDKSEGRDMRGIIAWLAIGDRAFNVAMFACMPPLTAIVVIGMVGHG